MCQRDQTCSCKDCEVTKNCTRIFLRCFGSQLNWGSDQPSSGEVVEVLFVFDQKAAGMITFHTPDAPCMEYLPTFGIYGINVGFHIPVPWILWVPKWSAKMKSGGFPQQPRKTTNLACPTSQKLTDLQPSTFIVLYMYVFIYIYMCFFIYKVGFWGVSQCFHSHIGPTKSIHYRSGPIDLARFSPCLFNEDPGYLDIPKNKGGLWMLLFWCLRYWLFGISYSMAFHCEFGCTVMCKMKFLVDLIVNLQMTAW